MLQWINLDGILALRYLIKPKIALPNEYAENINYIDIEDLRRKGIDSLILDLDGTLAAHGKNEPHELIKEKYDELKKAFGPKHMCVLSNYAGNKTDDRLNQVKNNFEIEVVQTNLKKPDLKAPEPALEYLRKSGSIKPAIVGDRILTDIICGNLLELYTILVNPIQPEQDPFYTKIPRLIEKIVLKCYILRGYMKEQSNGLFIKDI